MYSHPDRPGHVCASTVLCAASGIIVDMVYMISHVDHDRKLVNSFTNEISRKCHALESSLANLDSSLLPELVSRDRILVSIMVSTDKIHPNTLTSSLTASISRGANVEKTSLSCTALCKCANALCKCNRVCN